MVTLAPPPFEVVHGPFSTEPILTAPAGIRISPLGIFFIVLTGAAVVGYGIYQWNVNRKLMEMLKDYKPPIKEVDVTH
jgi:hypothetical protein